MVLAYCSYCLHTTVTPEVVKSAMQQLPPKPLTTAQAVSACPFGASGAAHPISWLEPASAWLGPGRGLPAAGAPGQGLGLGIPSRIPLSKDIAIADRARPSCRRPLAFPVLLVRRLDILHRPGLRARDEERLSAGPHRGQALLPFPGPRKPFQGPRQGSRQCFQGPAGPSRALGPSWAAARRPLAVSVPRALLTDCALSGPYCYSPYSSGWA